jgi:cytochrome c biogenesis protein CcdA
MEMRRRDGSTIEQVSGLVEDAETLVKLQVALAKQEVKEVASKSNLMAIGMLAAAGFLAVLTLLVVVPVVIVEAIPAHFIAALAWLVLYIVIILVLALVGRSMLKIKVPPRTIKSAMETKDWILQQLRQIRSPAR